MLPVAAVPEYLSPPHPPRRDVVPTARIVMPQLPCHDVTLPNTAPPRNASLSNVQLRPHYPCIVNLTRIYRIDQVKCYIFKYDPLATPWRPPLTVRVRRSSQSGDGRTWCGLCVSRRRDRSEERRRRWRPACEE
jgi:hypothetical protein